MDMEFEYGNLSNETLQAVEQYWGFQLPKSYRIFLLRSNGGSPIEKIFDFRNKKDGSCLDGFFGIVKDFNNNLLIYREYASKRVPKNMLPIADDVYGNLILLAVKNPDRGKIYFWDHELEVEEGEEPTYENLTLIADSFDEFINNLKPE